MIPVIDVKTALADATWQLEEEGIESAPLDAALLLAHVCGIQRETLMLNQSKILNDNDIIAFNAFVARRQQYEPIAYIIGKKEFWSLDFCVTPDTLIPRPDSETLIEAALKRVPSFAENGRAKPITLLDIGTGSACLLIALLKELPRAQGVGVDNSKRALQVAIENAKRHEVTDRTQFLESHWCDALNGTFDLIITNPPYVAEGALGTLMPDVVQYEPHTALFAGSDGLDAYRALAPQIAVRLNKGGYAVLEVGQGQAADVAGLLGMQGLKTETEKDLAGIDRCVIARKLN
jgi:release factor glutamine methyltransferase